jgi:hypothetical protein
MSLRRLVLVLLLAACAAPARAADEVRIIGDSIGEGLHMVSNVPSPANRFNVAIYTTKIFDQIREMPRGANVVMSLGTNDAVAGLVDAKARVDMIVAAAQAQGIKLTWLGPPCVRTGWEVHSKQLDEVIAGALQGTSVAYVSAQEPAFCEPSLHAGDGVHFTMAGYRTLWQKAAAVAGIPVVETAVSDTKPVAAGGKTAAARKRHKKKHVAPLANPPTSAPG